MPLSSLPFSPACYCGGLVPARTLKTQCRPLALHNFRLVVFVFLAVFLIAGHADSADLDDVLTIDKPPVSLSDLYFPDSEDIQPDKSDFKIISAILLSSKSGQRSATITFKNTSSGQRILSNNDVLAIFANGEKKMPLTFKQKFSGNQKISLNLNFGISHYPILSVYTLN